MSFLQNNKGLKINGANTSIWKAVVVRNANLVYNHNYKAIDLILQNYNELANTDFPILLIGGVEMSLEAIKTISEAEEQAKSIRLAAAAEAKRMLSEAEAVGKAAVDAAAKKARAELAELSQKADAKAADKAKELAAENEERKAQLKNRADEGMDKAVSLIVERIVNS